MRRIRQFHFFPGSPWSPKSRPFRGNIGINSGGHDTVMLPYPPMKLPKAHVTRYWSPWNQYSTTKGALPRKHFPPSELALVRVHVHIHDAWTVLVAHLGQRECGNSRSSKGRVSTEQNRTNLKRLPGMKEVVFYCDIVCPYAFMASKLIEGVARRTGAKIQWNRFFWVKYKNTEWWQGRILIYVIGLTAGTSNLRQNHVYYHKSSKKNLEKIIIIIVIMIMIVIIIIIIIIIILNNDKRNKDPSLRMSVKSLICTG